MSELNSATSLVASVTVMENMWAGHCTFQASLPLAQTARQSQALEGLLWLGVIFIALMLAVGAIRHVRRSRGGVLKADGPAFTLEQLRRLREQGEVTEPEYQALRQKVLAETNE